MSILSSITRLIIFLFIQILTTTSFILPSKSSVAQDARYRYVCGRMSVSKQHDESNINNKDSLSQAMSKFNTTNHSPENNFILTNQLDPKRRTKKERLGEYDPRERLPGGADVLVGDPQQKPQKEMSVSSILKELAAIQAQGPQKYCVLGTRHCSYLHQQIIELLAYALVLSGNHVYTSGAGGTHAATIRGALRAERPDLLTVVLPQSLGKQPKESQELLRDVTDLVTMPQNDDLTLDVASRICNSYLLSQTDQLVSFAFHESLTVIEATKEARELDMLVTTLFLD